MGRLLLICRLAARDLRRRRAEAALMLVVVAASAATLTLGLVLTGTTSNPYQATRAATDGPDVVAATGWRGRPAGPPPASLTALERAPGVTGYSGPYPVAYPVLRANGHTVSGGFLAEGRDQSLAPIDQPKVTQGTWVRPGGVVVEPTYAAELGVRPGDRLTLNGHPFTVAGLAVTAAWPSVNAPGLMWLTEADARSLASAADPLSYTLNLKLADPADATAVANSASAGGPGGLNLTSWPQISDHDGRQVQIEQGVLIFGAWLLSMLALASVAVLVGGRMSEQGRRVGLLKAVGGTPGLVAAVLLAEHVALALLAAAAGLAAGWLAAPLLTSPADGLIGAAGPPALTVGTAGLVAAVAVAVAILATFVPAVRAARTSTVAALADTARLPRRRTRMVAASRRLPVPMLLGLRLAVRRPRRLVLSAASIAITVAMVVGVLGMWRRRGTSRVPGELINPVDVAVARVLVVITVMLVVLAAVNAIFVAWATALDSRHPVAVARSLGATEDQIGAGLAVAQLVPALLGALTGIPAGLGLIGAGNHGGGLALPSAWTLLAVVPGTLLVVAALTAIPARAGARRPVTGLLQAEAA